MNRSHERAPTKIALIFLTLVLSLVVPQLLLAQAQGILAPGKYTISGLHKPVQIVQDEGGYFPHLCAKPG